MFAIPQAVSTACSVLIFVSAGAAPELGTALHWVGHLCLSHAAHQHIDITAYHIQIPLFPQHEQCSTCGREHRAVQPG